LPAEFQQLAVPEKSVMNPGGAIGKAVEIERPPSVAA
jgi:hypothetical protein